MTAPLCVVTNNTPVPHLLRIGQLPLLGRLFGQVLVPEQVVTELDRGRHARGAWREAPGAEVLITAVPLMVPCIDDMILTKRWSLRPKDVDDIAMLEKLKQGGGTKS